MTLVTQVVTPAFQLIQNHLFTVKMFAYFVFFPKSPTNPEIIIHSNMFKQSAPDENPSGSG